MARQMDLFAAVAGAYAEAASGTLTNADLYEAVRQRCGLASHELDRQVPIGKAGKRRSPMKRAIRWHQQTLRTMGVLQRVEGERGVWQLAEATDKALHAPREGITLLGFSTTLGIALWGDCSTALAGLDVPITLIVSSPPYPVRQARRYGGPTDDAVYIDFLCRALEPAIAHLAPGGSLCLNLTKEAAQAPAFKPG